jgi:hypothetical protein
MKKEAAPMLSLPAVVRTIEPFIPQSWPPVIHVPEKKVLHGRFDEHIAKFTKQDLDYFEALCFLRADKIARPYSALMRAPAMNDKESLAALVKQAVELVETKVEAAREADPELAGKILAYTIAALCEAPGCIPRGIEVDGPGFGDGADINIGHERASALQLLHDGTLVSLCDELARRFRRHPGLPQQHQVCE